MNLKRAAEIVSTAFADKVDKAGESYIKHIEFVFDKIFPADEELRCIACLHDLVEDCPEWTIERLWSEGFSVRVCEGVLALTKKKGENYEDYIDRVAVNQDAVLVKLADLQHNMDLTRLPSLSEKDIERVRKYHKAYWKLKNLGNE